MLGRSGPPAGVEAIPRTSRLTSPSRLPIERLRMTVLRRLDGLLAGDHAGLFPGHGTERGRHARTCLETTHVTSTGR